MADEGDTLKELEVTMVTAAEADFVVSAELIAATVTLDDEGTVAGAV